MEQKSINKLLQNSFIANWDRPAISNYESTTITYGELARKIAQVQVVFEACGLAKGDKVAICAKNQSQWGVAFLAALTYGAVPVPILHEFKASAVQYLVNHSEAKILFIGSVIWDNLTDADMPDLEAIVAIENFSLLSSKKEIYSQSVANAGQLFEARYPDGFSQKDVEYIEEDPEELALINYTSGTSGFSRGVMLPYRALLSNVMFADWAVHMTNESRMVAMLPSAHMYGLLFEFLYEMTVGAHVFFLTRLPSPKIIMAAFAKVKPTVIIAVPMIIEKIYKSMLLPFISKKSIKRLLNLPVIDQVIEKKILNSIKSAFGNEFYEVIIGGAAFNKEAEAFFRRIKFPFTVGYGMTECAPIITYAAWDDTRLYSCGKAAPRMEIRIDSEDQQNIQGEVLVRGENVFLGYYKNPEATAAAFTKDGWFRTGDVGVIDADGYLYLKGRCKSMILSANGQNIYPEEIESSINNMPYVAESLVIEDKGALVALIYPDVDLKAKENLSDEQLMAIYNEHVTLLNIELPNYCKIAKVEIFPEEFEKTPKRSIKRYLYQRN